MVPRYSEKGEDRTAALVWVGDDRARPQYIGQASLTWSGEMNNKLKQWLAEKQTDLHIFKALVRLTLLCSFVFLGWGSATALAFTIQPYILFYFLL